MIHMFHPGINGSAIAVNEDQALQMEAREWVRVDPSAAQVDYSGMRKGQLLDAAEAAGIDVPEKATVAELRELLESNRDTVLAVLDELPESIPADQED